MSDDGSFVECSCDGHGRPLTGAEFSKENVYIDGICYLEFKRRQ